VATKKKRKRKGPGRPKKIVGHKVSRDEVARQLIEGDIILDEQGREMRHVPSQRSLANRLGVAHSVISKIAISHDTARRHADYRRSHPEPFVAYEKYAARKKEQEGEEPSDPDALPPPKKRKPGRPSRIDSPNIPWNEVDRALVMGEMVQLPDGTQSTQYPALRELGRRYGVSHSAMVKYWQDHHCERRRETARQRLLDRTEEKITELRATAIAISKDDALRIIDKYLVKFEEALDQDRVRYDVPADFNTMLRLKEFLTGAPDSRTESTTSFTLEMLQERHARMLKETRQLSSAEMGIVDTSGHEVTDGVDTSSSRNDEQLVESAAQIEDENTSDEFDSNESIGADTAVHPPTRPFGNVAGQQTENMEAGADVEDSR
jgi:plasmid maintenance system antidote protein VapI